MSKTPAPKSTPSTAKSGKTQSKSKTVADDASAVATLEASPPPTANNRFADRFAPPKPPTRQMNANVIESPKSAAKADPKLVNAW
ncbi:MAG: RNA polymerase-binding protein DksA, partial [Burkholderiaceae bacterium]